LKLEKKIKTAMERANKKILPKGRRLKKNTAVNPYAEMDTIQEMEESVVMESQETPRRDTAK
jgi:hypothetical protein